MRLSLNEQFDLLGIIMIKVVFMLIVVKQVEVCDIIFGLYCYVIKNIEFENYYLVNKFEK